MRDELAEAKQQLANQAEELERLAENERESAEETARVRRGLEDTNRQLQVGTEGGTVKEKFPL